MRKEHKYFVGKLDRNGSKSGRRNCKAFVTWSLEGNRFSMSGEIWNHLGTDTFHCGQMVDVIAEQFPNDAKLQRMVTIWKRWHLNDMNAGSPVQMAWLRANPLPENEINHLDHYGQTRQRLAAVGLNPDADGYKYGSAWKREEIPADVVAEIESWSVAEAVAA